MLSVLMVSVILEQIWCHFTDPIVILNTKLSALKVP